MATKSRPKVPSELYALFRERLTASRYRVALLLGTRVSAVKVGLVDILRVLVECPDVLDAIVLRAVVKKGLHRALQKEAKAEEALSQPLSQR